jgi:hypothetical protein
LFVNCCTIYIFNRGYTDINGFYWKAFLVGLLTLYTHPYSHKLNCPAICTDSPLATPSDPRGCSSRALRFSAWFLSASPPGATDEPCCCSAAGCRGLAQVAPDTWSPLNVCVARGDVVTGGGPPRSAISFRSPTATLW